MNVLIFGIQGSGKSTIGRYLAEKLNVPFIATGDIFRALREDKSALGKLVRDRIDNGLLVPDEPTMEIVNQRLAEKDAKGGFVLDGAPRNMHQVEMFKSEVGILFQVNLDKDKAVERLLLRGRHDDTKEKIEKRMSWYKEQTKPVLDFYKSKGVKHLSIDNSESEEAVRRNLDGLLKEFKGN